VFSIGPSSSLTVRGWLLTTSDVDALLGGSVCVECLIGKRSHGLGTTYLAGVAVLEKGLALYVLGGSVC
jgi:hypothetical protein